MDDLLFAMFKMLDDWSPFFRSGLEDVSQDFDQGDEHPVDDQRLQRETGDNSRPIRVPTHRAPASR